MCNCRNKEGFNLVLSKAIAFEKSSGKEAGIFVIGENVSFTERSNISKVEGICCYFTTDGVEHEIPKSVEKTDVIEPEVVKPKKKTRKKKDAL